MPWHREPKKDATSCEKPRLAANKRYTRGCPNGETLMAKSHECYDEYIVITGEPAELKHLSRQRKRDQKRDSESSGERNRTRPNHGLARGVRDEVRYVKR